MQQHNNGNNSTAGAEIVGEINVYHSFLSSTLLKDIMVAFNHDSNTKTAASNLAFDNSSTGGFLTDEERESHDTCCKRLSNCDEDFVALQVT
eukprot:CAMPEP_0206392008 /NCGR_PEP_ID=MMETSP0294-20121207/19681_1 /ASSEMBLY_ACC=CAM_ASM_000327 /TAXON_ID=39354 /ORGANISM="Heterosigma akashiwo, Strain CCMP2393" /LENGTH=91 /DNA_ID=CAMNT_0053844961 /DNA_START=20 /DNA_END=291 /DNA_ORIENTATION=+